MREQFIRQSLDEYATYHLPARPDPWPAIRRQLQPHRPRLGFGLPLPTARPRLATAILLLLLVFTTAGAVAVGVRSFYSWEPNRSRLIDAKLLREVDLSQTANGYTVTLRHAYADANIIMVDTTIRDPAGQLLYNVRPTWQLTDEHGTVFSTAMGVGGGTIEVGPGTIGQVAYFDAAPVQGNPAALHLRLALTVEEPAWNWQVPPPGAPASSVVAISPVLGAAVSGAAAATPTVGALHQYRPIAPSFTFDFTVPFIRGTTIEPQQTVTTAGVAMTLRRVVFTPAETRATVCYTSTVGRAEDRWQLVADDDGRLVVGENAHRSLPVEPSERCALLHLDAYEGRSGIRGLRVKDLSWGPTATETRLNGPWIFHLNVP